MSTMEQQEQIKMPIGPITRSRAKRYQTVLNAYCQQWISDYIFDDDILDLGGRDVCLVSFEGYQRESGGQCLN